MKIRIRGNTVRFRLTKSEVETLCTTGTVKDRTQFSSSDFIYIVKSSNTNDLKIDFVQNGITLFISSKLLQDWHKDERIGFYHSLRTVAGNMLDLALEKDFICLDTRDEDQSDNYPNPKLEESAPNGE